MPTTPRRLLLLAVAAAVLLVGCGGDDRPAPEAGAEAPAWQDLPITDVDGATFTLSSLAGRPVLVETFATWCPSCRDQLGRTQEAAAELGEEAVVLALSVETDLDAAAVADYAADNGFDDVRFAVMTPELLAAMVGELGNTVANPPSTPKLVIASDGTTGELETGSASAADLVTRVRAAA